MEERDNRTIMCSVLFLDIVEYSKMSVSGQISVKDRFNSYLSAAIQDVPVADRIILDTGDGAAINFLGDVQDALKTALSLRESLLNEGARLNPPLLIRAGINLGPVRLVRDINGQPNIVGDGINVAQRIMAFADIDQILVSRSYHDAVSRLSSQYEGMFTYQGSRTDKHVREHEVYAIGHLGEKTAQLINTSMLEVQKPGIVARFLTFSRAGWITLASWSNSITKTFSGNKIKALKSRFEKADTQQRAIYAGAIVVPLVLTVMLAFMLGGQDETSAPPMPEPTVAASGIEPSPTIAAEIPAVPDVESKSAGTSPGQPATEPKPVIEKSSKSTPAPKKPATSTAAKSKSIKQPAIDWPAATIDQPRSSQSTNQQPEQTATQRKSPPAEPADKKTWFENIIEGDNEPKGAPAHIVVRCNPGTGVFVDGAQKGKITSRTLAVDVPPGTHTVIVTSPLGVVYSQQIKLSAGRTVNISPDFCD